MNASGYSRLSFAVNFCKRQGESNVYDELKASGPAPREVVTAPRVPVGRAHGRLGEMEGVAAANGGICFVVLSN